MVFLMAGCNGEESNSKEKEETVKPDSMILATTTSTQDSGLLDELIPIFEKKHNVKVKTIAVGTGEALAMGQKGEADALLVHAPKSEKAVVDAGDAINYKRVMYNDFIITGPHSDPAKIKGLSAVEALQKINQTNFTFISRGDDSGTHKKELDIWKSAGVNPKENKKYLETGQGMGATLQMAAEKQAYVLTDRATYLAQQKNLSDMDILVEGEESLKNIYHVMQVNPKKFKQINDKAAKSFVEFMISDDTQRLIADFGKKEYNEPLFFSYTE